MYIAPDTLSFGEARLDCESRNLSLIVAPTYEEYTKFEKELFKHTYVHDEFWIGLNRSAGDDEYQWLSGDRLNVYWKNDGLHELHKRHCVVADDANAMWKTENCHDDEYYLCVNYTNSDTDYNIYPNPTNYYIAKQHCRSLGQDLAMIKNRHQYDALKSYLISLDLGDGVWIGLEGFGQDKEDYRKFRWVDGDYMNTIDGTSERMQMDTTEKCVVYKDGEWETKDCSGPKHYICSDRFIEPEPEILTNYYHELKNKLPTATYLKQLTVKSKSRCAVECSKYNDCYMYTYGGMDCRLYGKYIKPFIDNTEEGPKLNIRQLKNIRGK